MPACLVLSGSVDSWSSAVQSRTAYAAVSCEQSELRPVGARNAWVQTHTASWSLLVGDLGVSS